MGKLQDALTKLKEAYQRQPEITVMQIKPLRTRAKSVTPFEIKGAILNTFKELRRMWKSGSSTVLTIPPDIAAEFEGIDLQGHYIQTNKKGLLFEEAGGEE
jgi:hypothetical protein